MPVYKDFRKIKEVSLPSVPDSKIQIFNTILAGDTDLVMKEESDFAKGLALLAILIKDWNLTDEAGNKLPIKESLKRFSLEDVTYLLNQTDLKEFGKAGGGKQK